MTKEIKKPNNQQSNRNNKNKNGAATKHNKPNGKSRNTSKPNSKNANGKKAATNNTPKTSINVQALKEMSITELMSYAKKFGIPDVGSLKKTRNHF